MHGFSDDEVTRTNDAIGKAATRANLLWDDEARRPLRQRFIRIGSSPLWSLETARALAKELRSIDRGRDPAREHRGREIPPVENLIQYIAESLERYCGRPRNCRDDPSRHGPRTTGCCDSSRGRLNDPDDAA
jgi:hypothetical protein